jgi:hypothetical protein
MPAKQRGKMYSMASMFGLESIGTRIGSRQYASPRTCSTPEHQRLKAQLANWSMPIWDAVHQLDDQPSKKWGTARARPSQQTVRMQSEAAVVAEYVLILLQMVILMHKHRQQLMGFFTIAMGTLSVCQWSSDWLGPGLYAGGSHWQADSKHCQDEAAAIRWPASLIQHSQAIHDLWHNVVQNAQCNIW